MEYSSVKSVSSDLKGKKSIYINDFMFNNSTYFFTNTTNNNIGNNIGKNNKYNNDDDDDNLVRIYVLWK